MISKPTNGLGLNDKFIEFIMLIHNLINSLSELSLSTCDKWRKERKHVSEILPPDLGVASNPSL